MVSDWSGRVAERGGFLGVVVGVVGREVHEVVADAVLVNLAADVKAAGERLVVAWERANDSWDHTGVAFQVGALPESDIDALVGCLRSDVDAFRDSCAEAASRLEVHRLNFDSLRLTREALIADIVAVDRWHRNVVDPPGNVPIDPEEHDRVDREVNSVRERVAQFNTSVENIEEGVADSLRTVHGGEEVTGPDGSRVNTSATSWGWARPRVGNRFSTDPPMTGTEWFRSTLTSQVLQTVTWLTTATQAEAAAFLEAHPDVYQAVGMIDVDRAAAWWENITAQSPPVDGSWTGPAATLLAIAPGIVGNMNGIPATVRDHYNRQHLTNEITDETARYEELVRATQADLANTPQMSGVTYEAAKRYVDHYNLYDTTHRDSLNALQEQLKLTEAGWSLLSLFTDNNGDLRTSVAVGDVASADVVTTLTHGISNDFDGSHEEWLSTAVDTYDWINDELEDAGRGESAAVVLFMEWDSGDATTVQGEEFADSGASRYSQLVEGLQVHNPQAHWSSWSHSYGTTMTGQAITQNPGMLDLAVMFGSAGITTEAQAGITAQVRQGDLAIAATHAGEDWIAPLGRSEPLSEHSVDPREVAGVTEFGSNGGYVAGFGGGDGEYGEATEGHNARESDALTYAMDGVNIVSTPAFSVYFGFGADGVSLHTDSGSWLPGLVHSDSGRQAAGYLDVEAQAFKEGVMFTVAQAGGGS